MSSWTVPIWLRICWLKWLVRSDERAHLVGDDGEAAPGLAGPRRLDRGVEREQVRLARDALDLLEDLDHRGHRAVDLVHFLDDQRRVLAVLRRAVDEGLQHGGGLGDEAVDGHLLGAAARGTLDDGDRELLLPRGEIVEAREAAQELPDRVGEEPFHPDQFVARVVVLVVELAGAVRDRLLRLAGDLLEPLLHRGCSRRVLRAQPVGLEPVRIGNSAADQDHDQRGDRDVGGCPSGAPPERSQRAGAEDDGRGGDAPLRRIVDYRSIRNHRHLRAGNWAGHARLIRIIGPLSAAKAASKGIFPRPPSPGIRDFSASFPACA